MKKTLFLLITILMISFIGCSDDDDSEYKDAIIGTWELTQIEFGGGWTSICLLYTSPSPRDTR